MLKHHNMITDCDLSHTVCVCVCAFHIWMFSTSLGRDSENRYKVRGSEREKLMRVIVLSKPTVSALGMTGNMVHSS